jgi:hypothetical protein
MILHRITAEKSKKNPETKHSGITAKEVQYEWKKKNTSGG